jgi:hypothetical protein
VSTFALGLALALGVMLLQQCLPRNAGLTRALQCVACLTAPLLFACLLLGMGRAATGNGAQAELDYQHSGGLFVSFLGLHKSLAGGLRIGGAPASSDYFIERVPDDVVVIDKAGTVHAATSATRGDVFSATEGGLEDFARRGTIATWALHSGSRLCFARAGATGCAHDVALAWTLEGGQLRVTRGASAPTPACSPQAVVRGFRLQALLHRVPTAQERVFPLDIYGRPGCAGGAVELEQESTLRQTFLHFGADGQLYVSQLPGKRGEDTLVVEEGDPVVRRGAKLPSNGERRTLTVFRLQTSSPLPVVELTKPLWISRPTVETGRSRLVRITTLEVRLLSDSGAANTAPDTIEVMALRPAVAEIRPASTCRQWTVVNLLGVGERARPLAEGSQQGEAVARVPFLWELGRIGATGALIEVQRNNRSPSVWEAHGCRSFERAEIGVIGASGGIDGLRGSEIASLGTPEQGVLRMSVAEYGVPGLWILGLLSLMAAVRMVLRWGTWRTLAQSATICAVVMVAEVLLVIRLMVAIQEIAAQPSAPSRVTAALLVLLAVPLLLDVLMSYVNTLGRRTRKFLAIGQWRPAPSAARRGAATLAANVRRTGAMAVLVAVVPALHLLLVLAGFREQIFGIRLTAILVPAYVVILAILVGAACARRPWAALLPWLGLLVCGGLAFITFVLARDVGAVITLTGAFVALGVVVSLARHLPGAAIARVQALGAYGLTLLVAVLVCAAVLLYAGRRGLGDAALLGQHPALPSLGILALVLGGVAIWRWRTRTAWLLAAPGGVIVLVLVGLSSAHFEDRAENCVGQDLEKVAACLERQSLDTNQLRLSYLLYPTLTQVNLSGEARGISSVFDELRWVTTQFKGQGFMSVPPRIGLDQHDNVIATHLIGPQGRTSAQLLCALLILPLLFLSLTRRQRRLGASHPISWLAYACFAFTSVYMVLANLLLVPFTGRNVYLTNALSGTDLLEGGMLLLLTLVPLACTRLGGTGAR